MENKAIDKMTVQEMAQEILNNLKERKGTEAELKVSLRDCTLLRAIASDGNPDNSENANCAIFDVSQRRELLLAFMDWYDKEVENRLPMDGNIFHVNDFLKDNNCG